MDNANYPRVLYVGSSSIEQYDEEPIEEIERDPRGLLLCWELPDTKSHYIIGLDSSEGITGWTRGTRTDNDHKTDNGAIEVFKIGAIKELIFKINDLGNEVPIMDPETGKQKCISKDVQVAEFAAPCDAVEIARVVNIIGRIYCGDAEDQCELIWESWPGCGILCTQELLRLNYGNLWHWEYIDSVAEDSNRLGWRSTRESQKLLWQKSRRHLMKEQGVIRSKYLLAEYSNAEIDMDKMRARAAYGFHDDRFQAANMAFWGGNKWTYSQESSHEEVRESKEIDYQRYAPGLDDYVSYTQHKEDLMSDWE